MKLDQVQCLPNTNDLCGSCLSS